MPRKGILAAVAAAVVLAGCGGARPARAPNGTSVFAQDCQICHTLVGNESRQTQGGDLLGFSMSRRDLTEFAREMPTRHRLSSPALAAVVRYVLAEQRRARHHP
jgi:mono/diheme cytochrome c family protein